MAGRNIFKKLGCDFCHTGPDSTDSVQGKLHDVGTLKQSSGMRGGEPLLGIDTPTLNGVWETPPYLHDGSAATLRDVLTTANADERHAFTSGLSEAGAGPARFVRAAARRHRRSRSRCGWWRCGRQLRRRLAAACSARVRAVSGNLGKAAAAPLAQPPVSSTLALPSALLAAFAALVGVARATAEVVHEAFASACASRRCCSRLARETAPTRHDAQNTAWDSLPAVVEPDPELRDACRRAKRSTRALCATPRGDAFFQSPVRDAPRPIITDFADAC